MPSAVGHERGDPRADQGGHEPHDVDHAETSRHGGSLAIPTRAPGPGLVARTIGRLAAFSLGKPGLAEFLALRLGSPRECGWALWNEAAFRLGLDRASVLTTLNVELTSRCNVACSYCDVNRELGRPGIDLDLAVLERLLDDAPHVHTLLPFQWGEPFLHPELDRAVAMATERRVTTWITTNGTLLDGPRLERLAAAGLRHLTVSLDGDEAVHRERRGYAQGPILERIAEARHARDRLGLPVSLHASMVVDEHVADQRAEVTRRLESLVDRVQFIPRLQQRARSKPCREPSRGLMVVLSDGSITTCCPDVRGELALGHVDDGDAHSIYGGAKWRRLRAEHRAGHFRGPCEQCDEACVAGTEKRFA